MTIKTPSLDINHGDRGAGKSKLDKLNLNEFKVMFNFSHNSNCGWRLLYTVHILHFGNHCFPASHPPRTLLPSEEVCDVLLRQQLIFYIFQSLKKKYSRVNIFTIFFHSLSNFNFTQTFLISTVYVMLCIISKILAHNLFLFHPSPVH